MEIRKNKNGLCSYKEKVYLPDGRTKTKTFKRKTDAIFWKKNLEIELIKNDFMGSQSLKDNIYFFELYNKWYDRKIVPAKSNKTISDYRYVGSKYLLPTFGNIKIRSIERSHGDILLQKLKTQNLQNKTINKIITIFKQILIYAEIEGHLFKSPLRNFPMLKITAGRVDFLSHQEILQLLNSNNSEEIYPILVLALNTGMRIGEIGGLCWDRVDFITDTIEVSRAITRNGLKQSTKTNLVRYIPMNYEVRSTLMILKQIKKDSDFVFLNKDMLPINPDHFSKRQFTPALIRANVRSINFHLLRHTFASHFMMNGGNIYDLQKILGHTKVEMTMKYAHLSPQHLRKAMNVVRYIAQDELTNIHSPELAP